MTDNRSPTPDVSSAVTSVTAFLVPAEGGLAARFGEYLGKINSDLNSFTGRFWWTGTKGQHLKYCAMGKNTLGKAPHDVALRLKLPNPKDHTFLSYRRTSNNCCQRRYD
jgi:hypothetical protein